MCGPCEGTRVCSGHSRHVGQARGASIVGVSGQVVEVPSIANDDQKWRRLRACMNSSTGGTRSDGVGCYGFPGVLRARGKAQLRASQVMAAAAKATAVSSAVMRIMARGMDLSGENEGKNAAAHCDLVEVLSGLEGGSTAPDSKTNAASGPRSTELDHDDARGSRLSSWSRRT